MSKETRKLQPGDVIWMEEAWEDETGAYHDEEAKVEAVEDGRLVLSWPNVCPAVAEFLRGCEFLEEDYRDERII